MRGLVYVSAAGHRSVQKGRKDSEGTSKEGAEDGDGGASRVCLAGRAEGQGEGKGGIKMPHRTLIDLHILKNPRIPGINPS